MEDAAKRGDDINHFQKVGLALDLIVRHQAEAGQKICVQARVPAESAKAQVSSARGSSFTTRRREKTQIPVRPMSRPRGGIPSSNLRSYRCRWPIAECRIAR